MKKKFKTSQRPAKSLQWPLRLLLGFSLSATQWVVANKVADMVADMEVDMVADMEVDKAIDIVWTARNNAGGGRGGRQWGFKVS